MKWIGQKQITSHSYTFFLLANKGSWVQSEHYFDVTEASALLYMTFLQTDRGNKV